MDKKNVLLTSFLSHCNSSTSDYYESKSYSEKTIGPMTISVFSALSADFFAKKD